MQKTIIVADDDGMFRLTIQRHLHILGFEMIELKNGKNMLNFIQQYTPVACIIDLVMAEKEGIETICEVLRLPNRPLIIATSSNILYLNFAKEIGADDILQKPVTPASLTVVLQNSGILPRNVE